MEQDFEPLTTGEDRKEKRVVLLSPRAREFLATTAVTRGIYPTCAGHFTRPRRYLVERENYPESVLLFCVEGCGKVEVDLEKYRVGAGDVVLMPARLRHLYCPESDHAWTIYWAHYCGELSPDYESRFYARWGGWKGRSRLPFELARSFDTLIDLQYRTHWASGSLHAAKVLEMALADLALSPQGTAITARQKCVQRAIDFMSERLERSLMLDDIAQYCAVSRFQLSHWFKEETDTSPMQYFNSLKAYRGARMLIDTDATVAEIAYQLGFEDPFYFSRLFKQIMGTSPSNYRAAAEQAWG